MMEAKIELEIDADDMKKDKRLAKFVMQMLAKQAKEKPKKMEEMQESENMED